MLVGVYSILAVFPQTLQSVRNSGKRSVLNHLVSQQVEYLRSVGFAHSDMGAGTHPTLQTDSTGSKYYPVSGFDEIYSMRWIVSGGPTDGTGSAVAGLKTVTIEASHGLRYDGSGNPIADPEALLVSLTTYVAE